jgi:NADH:ubiquinone oxidoreductase subunit E
MMDEVLSRFAPSQKELISILHAVQAKYGYIPKEAIARISRFLRVSESEIFGVLTFYKGFSLEPRGKFIVTVCLGTACHVRGGANIAAELERRLGIKVGDTTPDRKFTLDTVNCLGCCAIGPVVAIDGNYYGHATIQNVGTILEKYQKPQEPEAPPLDKGLQTEGDP